MRDGTPAGTPVTLEELDRLASLLTWLQNTAGLVTAALAIASFVFSRKRHRARQRRLAILTIAIGACTAVFAIALTIVTSRANELTQPRRLSHAEEVKLVEAMRVARFAETLAIVYVTDDSETADLAGDIRRAFGNAGWLVQPFPHPPSMVTSRGAALLVPPSPPYGGPSADRIAAALTRAGISLSRDPPDDFRQRATDLRSQRFDWQTSSTAVVLVIGPRPQRDQRR